MGEKHHIDINHYNYKIIAFLILESVIRNFKQIFV